MIQVKYNKQNVDLKGDYKKHGLSTNNCRIENILTSKLFKEPLQRGNRCVILAEGFYEWKTTDKSKQPYYIYCKQDESLKVCFIALCCKYIFYNLVIFF